MDADLAPVELDSEDSKNREERARGDEVEDEDEDEVEDEDKDEDEDEDEDEEDDEGIPDELNKIQKYLLTLTRLVGMSDKVYDSFHQFAFKLLVHEGLLLFRKKVNIPFRGVIWDKAQHQEII